MFSEILFGVILVMRLFPSAPIVRSMHKFMVEMPALWLSHVERRHIVYCIVVLALLLGGFELIALYGSFDALLVFSLDASFYFEAVVMLSLLTATNRIKTTFSAMKNCLVHTNFIPRRGLNERKNKKMRAHRHRQPSNDDDEGNRRYSEAA